MKQILVPICCHKCGWEGYHLSQMVIIPQFEPDLRKALLNQHYFKATCMNCGAIIPFKHECIYQDKANGFVLWMNKKKEHQNHYEDHIKVVLIDDEKLVSEKIIIFEDRLVDEKIDQLKQKLKQNKGYQEIYYYDQQDDHLWFEGDGVLIAIAKKYY